MPIFSYTMALPKNKKSCLASAQRKSFFEEDDSALLCPDTSVIPTAQLRAFLECSWAGKICVLQMKERTV